MRLSKSPSPIPAARDYYWTLGVPHNATDADIDKAYQQLALRWHPSRNVDDKLLAEKNFRDVSEAYQILSNRILREAYDKFGREGLLPDDEGFDFKGLAKKPQVYPFKEAMEIFRHFFHGADPAHIRPSSVLYDEHGFEKGFPGFPRPVSEVSRPPKSKAGFTLYKGYMFSGPTDEDDFKSVCITTKVIDGGHIVTNRLFWEGVETITIKEDGVLKSKTVDGRPQPI